MVVCEPNIGRTQRASKIGKIRGHHCRSWNSLRSTSSSVSRTNPAEHRYQHDGSSVGNDVMCSSLPHHHHHYHPHCCHRHHCIVSTITIFIISATIIIYVRVCVAAVRSCASRDLFFDPLLCRSRRSRPHRGFPGIHPRPFSPNTQTPCRNCPAVTSLTPRY